MRAHVLLSITLFAVVGCKKSDPAAPPAAAAAKPVEPAPAPAPAVPPTHDQAVQATQAWLDAVATRDARQIAAATPAGFKLTYSHSHVDEPCGDGLTPRTLTDAGTIGDCLAGSDLEAKQLRAQATSKAIRTAPVDHAAIDGFSVEMPQGPGVVYVALDYSDGHDYVVEAAVEHVGGKPTVTAAYVSVMLVDD